MDTEDFENVSLSGSESDASYDMADDALKMPRENEDSVAIPARETSKIDMKVNNFRQSLSEKVSSAKTSYFKAVEAELRSKSAAIAEKKMFEAENVQLKCSLQEVKTQYTLMANSERDFRARIRAENDILKRSCGDMKALIGEERTQHLLVLKQESQARDSLVRQNRTLREDLATAEDSEKLQLKKVTEYQRALAEATTEQIAEENKHKTIVENIEKKLVRCNKTIESLQKFITSMVITDCKRVTTIEKLNTQLSTVSGELSNIQSSRDILPGARTSAEHTKSPDPRRANTAKLGARREDLIDEMRASQSGKYLGEELPRIIKTCSDLKAEKKNLITHIAFLENELAASEQQNQKLRDTNAPLFQDI